MAEVNCRYCKKKFDRDKESFVQIPVGTTGTVFRYAHADCYLKEFNGILLQQQLVFGVIKHQILQIKMLLQCQNCLIDGYIKDAPPFIRQMIMKN